MPMPSMTDFLNASNYTYKQTSQYPSGLTPLMTGGQPVVSKINSDGFYAQAFMNSTGQVIIAYEGTVPNPFSAYGRGTISADATLAGGTTPTAFTDAQNFAQSVMSIANQQGITNDNIFVTGHSLGGAEAESVSAQFGLGGATFGAPGIPGYTSSGAPSNLTDYVNYGDPVGNFAADSGYGSALGTTNGHVGTVSYIGNQADGQALTDTASNINNPTPGSDSSSNFFYALGYAIGGIQYHSLDLYSSLLTGSSLQQISQANTNSSDAYAMLESLDGPLGAAGQQDLASATIVGGKVESTDFTIADNAKGDYYVTENQPVSDSDGDVSDILGTARIVTDPSTGEIISAHEDTGDGQRISVSWDQSDDTIASSKQVNSDGTYTETTFNSDGSSVVTDYGSDHQETGQTNYPAPSPTPSPTPPAPSPVPSPTPPAPSPVPSPTPPAPRPVPSPVPSPTPPAPSPVPSPTPPAPSPVPSPVPSPTPPAPSPVPSPTPPAPSPVPSPVPSPTPPAPSPVPSPTPPAPSPVPSPVPSPTPPAPSPVPSPPPPAPSPVPSPISSPVSSPAFSPAAAALSKVGKDNADGGGLHPRVGQSSMRPEIAGMSAMRPAIAAPNRPLGSPVHGVHSAGSPVQHLMPDQSPAAHAQAMSRSLTRATVGTVRSLAESIAQAGRERFGTRSLQAGAVETGSARPPVVQEALHAATPGEAAAHTAAALLRQAVVAYAPTGTMAPNAIDAEHHAPQQVAGTPPGAAHH